jgi:hypothetical protein
LTSTGVLDHWVDQQTKRASLRYVELRQSFWWALVPLEPKTTGPQANPAYALPLSQKPAHLISRLPFFHQGPD